MEGAESEPEMIARAAAGEEYAVKLLLWKHHDRLLGYIGRRLPASLQASISPEDILQQTFGQAWKDIGRFKAHGPESFLRWLTGIARHRLQDAIKMGRCEKRGGGRRQAPLQQPDPASSSAVDLLNLLAGNELTPSRQAMRREAKEILRHALDELPEDRRRVLELRFLEQLDWSEVATRMGRRKGAVMMLSHRALEELREKLGNASQYLSSK